MASTTFNGTPSAFVSGSYSSISNQTNPVGKESSNTTYATITCKTGSSAETYAFWSFDCTDIPLNATIESVSCTAKCYASSTSYISTRQVQLYNGTSTAKGSSVTYSNSTSATQTLTCGTWTRSELSSCYIRIYGKRGTSNTSRSATLRFYGASLSITYTYQQTLYTVTVTANGDGTVTPSGSIEIEEGSGFDIVISPEDGADFTITDNGTDVTSSAHEQASSGTLTSNIAAYTTSGSISGTYYQSAVGKGSDATATTNNNYCSTSGSTADINYTFSLDDIPSGATITSVQCAVKGHCESASASTEVAKCQLYSGTTAKGTAISFTSTTDSVITVDGGTSWTASEIKNLILKFTIGYYGGNVSGATLTVTYTLEGGDVVYVYSITNVTAARTVNVTFLSSAILYTVSGTITNGTINSPTLPALVREGGALMINFSGNEGYEFTSMKVNGVSVTPTKSTISTNVEWTVTTNYSTYQTYNLSNVHDGDTSSYFWSSEAQATGKYVLVTFTTPVTLNSFQTYSSNSTDMPGTNNVLQVSSDGETWNTVGTFQATATSTFSNINKNNVKYARIYASSDASSWLVLNEITIDATIPSNDYTYKIASVTENTSFTIIFSAEETQLIYQKSGSTWKQITIYKKISGSWVVQTEYSNVFTDPIYVLN